MKQVTLIVLSSIRRLLSLPLNAANRFAMRAPKRPPMVKSISMDPSLFCFKAAKQTPPMIGMRHSHLAVEIFFPYLKINQSILFPIVRNHLHEGPYDCGESRFSSLDDLSEGYTSGSQGKHGGSMSTRRTDPRRKHTNEVIDGDLRRLTSIRSHP